MAELKNWISAFRLRTLPLSLSVVALGAFLAAAAGRHDMSVTVLALLTTLLLQVLSNLANDYGDGVKGTDNERRTGPARTLQSGKITRGRMKTAVVVFMILSFVSGTALLWVSLSLENLLLFGGFFLLGTAAVWAAVKYTVGRSAYGYRGLGDLFVFIFFGLAGSGGTYFLHVQSLPPEILLPAASMGLLSAGVLNLNNMRDIENDAESGKRTLAVILGIENARLYHVFLLVTAVVLTAVFVVFTGSGSWSNYLFLAAVPLLVFNIVKVFNTRAPAELDPLLKQLALTTALFSLLTGAGQVWGVLF